MPRSLVCNECGKKFRSQTQAEYHASKSEHVDFQESTEEIAPLTEEQKQSRLEELRQKLASKRAVQSEQEKEDKKRNEVRNLLYLKSSKLCLSPTPGHSQEEHQGIPRHPGGSPEETENEGSTEEEAGETR